MKKTCIKGLSLLVSLVITVTLLSGFGKAGNSTAVSSTKVPNDYVTLKILMPGDESARMKDFLNNDLKKKLKEDLNLGIDVSYVGWDQYWSKKDMMLAAGQQIDFYWDGMPNISNVIAKKQAMAIDDLLNKYGQDIKKAIPSINFKTTVFNGKTMAIPSQYAPTAEKFRSVLVRQDILEAVGMKTIKSADDLSKFFKLAKAKYPEMKAVGEDLNVALIRQYSDGLTTTGGNDTPVAYDEKTKKAVSYFETDTFKKAAKQMGIWSAAGYVPEDVTIKPKDNRIDQGQYLVSDGAISRPMENIATLHRNVPNGKYAEYLLAPEKSSYKTMASTEIICIGATSKYPDRAMQLLNWIYKSKDNYNMFIYGVKGKDYKIENGRIVQLTNDTFFPEWMFRNINMMSFPTTVDDKFINIFKNWDKNAKISGIYGFQFDATPVKSEAAKIASVYNEKILPIETGYVDFDKNYSDAIKALKAAGIDKYVAEYQNQLNAYQAKNK